MRAFPKQRRTGQILKPFIDSGKMRKCVLSISLRLWHLGVVERIKDYPVILAIQDTTDLSFSHHASKRKESGFGPISAHLYSLGLKVHSSLVVTTEGVPLGLLDQKTWAREPKQKGKNKQKKKHSLFENIASAGLVV